MQSRTWRILGILALALVLIIIAACSGDSATQTPATDVAPTKDSASASTGGQHTPASTAESPAPSASARPSERSGQPQDRHSVVTTSNIVADWVRAVGQDRVEVFSLLPANADPHTFQPGAQDITRVADADLVFSVGLSLEASWLEELIDNAARSNDVAVALGNVVNPIDFLEIVDEHAAGYTYDEAILGRLLIGDGDTGMLSVIDLVHGDVDQDAFDLGGSPQHLLPTSNGRFAVAVSSSSNSAYVFDGGVYLEGHGDHFDQVLSPVSQLDIDLSGDGPANLNATGDWATIFYVASGDVVLLNQQELEGVGNDYLPPQSNVGAHNGAAVPLGDGLFAITIQHPDYDSDPDTYSQPIGAEVVNLGGDVLHHDEGCKGLLGHAGSGHMAAFGCMGGARVVEAHDGDYEGVFIPAPAGEPNDFRLTSVWGRPGLDQFFAQSSAGGLYLVDPEEGSMKQFVAPSEDLDPTSIAVAHDGEALLVLMSDGELRLYDAHDLDLDASASDFLTAPVSNDFQAHQRVATAPGAVFVTDPIGGRVVHLDDRYLQVVDEWTVAGNPSSVAFVGILGDTEGQEEHGHGEEEDEGHGHGALDPHFWFDPLRVKQAVNSIAAQLSTVDPAGQGFYRDNAAAYNRELDNLHLWVREQVASLSEDRRVLVTSHDSFQYFAMRYGFEVAGAIFPVTTEAEPTAQDLAKLIEVIEQEGAPAVFTERSHSERLAQRVAEETGAKLVGGLYTGSLGEEGGEAGSYIDLMRHNTSTIVEALK